MRRRIAFILFVASIIAISLGTAITQAEGPRQQGSIVPKAPVGTSFTYQGQLKQSGTAANGSYDFQFSLWDAASAGTQIGSTQTLSGVTVTDGLFTVQLDFGSVFDGNSRWLQIAVRPAGSGGYTTLSPRQAIAPSPYAINADTIDGQHATAFWNTAGNAGTTPGTNFVGTTDNVALELDVNGTRALRLEPNGSSPNVIGGYSGNSVTSGKVGAAISGGGSSVNANQVSDDYGAVGGGASNTAGYYAVVGGGYFNGASAFTAVVAGGNNNNASGSNAAVGGGSANTASGSSATVPGGSQNTAAGKWSFAAGNRAKANNDGAFVWADSTNGDFASTAPDQFMVRASGGVTMTAGSGAWRIVPNADSPNVIGGYSGNSVADGKWGAVIAGGGRSGYPNQVTAIYGTVGGGINNTASGGSATVGGGGANTASGNDATVGGGNSNTASGNYATVVGGQSNTASSLNGTVGGGGYNIASGAAATVPGGANNTAAGLTSFAAGYRAKANHDGTFVWADSTDTDFASNGPNQFLVRASGGVTMTTNTGGTTGATLMPGSGSWSSLSDRNAKENLAPVNSQAILEKVASVPIDTWNYKTQDKSIRHIGPMAQDFYAAFNVGEDDKRISTVDADGVALAAIQGLYQEIRERDARIEAQQKSIDELQKRLSALEPARR